MKPLVFAVVVFCAGCVAFCGCAQKSEKINTYKINPNAHSAVIPVPRQDDWWTKRHQAILDRVAQSNVDLIFIGDSITHNWETNGAQVWGQYYSKRNAVNMGFGGDRTQHALWRLQHGEITGISPKLAVVMIGTNNSNCQDNSAKEIGEGIIAICKQLRHDLPNTRILLLGIFPRNEYPCAQRQKNAEASLLASTIADKKWIYYMDIGDNFLEKDGTLRKDLMPDGLHPNSKGYQIEAETIEPMVEKLMATGI